MNQAGQFAVVKACHEEPPHRAKTLPHQAGKLVEGGRTVQKQERQANAPAMVFGELRDRQWLHIRQYRFFHGNKWTSTLMGKQQILESSSFPVL